MTYILPFVPVDTFPNGVGVTSVFPPTVTTVVICVMIVVTPLLPTNSAHSPMVPLRNRPTVDPISTTRSPRHYRVSRTFRECFFTCHLIHNLVFERYKASEPPGRKPLQSAVRTCFSHNPNNRRPRGHLPYAAFKNCPPRSHSARPEY